MPTVSRTAAAKGCRFYQRCPHRMDRCLAELPPLYQVGTAGHRASCFLYDPEKAVAA